MNELHYISDGVKIETHPNLGLIMILRPHYRQLHIEQALQKTRYLKIGRVQHEKGLKYIKLKARGNGDGTKS